MNDDDLRARLHGLADRRSPDFADAVPRVAARKAGLVRRRVAAASTFAVVLALVPVALLTDGSPLALDQAPATAGPTTEPEPLSCEGVDYDRDLTTGHPAPENAVRAEGATGPVTVTQEGGRFQAVTVDGSTRSTYNLVRTEDGGWAVASISRCLYDGEAPAPAPVVDEERDLWCPAELQPVDAPRDTPELAAASYAMGPDDADGHTFTLTGPLPDGALAVVQRDTDDAVVARLHVARAEEGWLVRAIDTPCAPEPTQSQPTHPTEVAWCETDQPSISAQGRDTWAEAVRAVAGDIDPGSLRVAGDEATDRELVVTRLAPDGEPTERYVVRRWRTADNRETPAGSGWIVHEVAVECDGETSPPVEEPNTNAGPLWCTSADVNSPRDWAAVRAEAEAAGHTLEMLEYAGTRAFAAAIRRTAEGQPVRRYELERDNTETLQVVLIFDACGDAGVHDAVEMCPIEPFVTTDILRATWYDGGLRSLATDLDRTRWRLSGEPARDDAIYYDRLLDGEVERIHMRRVPGGWAPDRGESTTAC